VSRCSTPAAAACAPLAAVLVPDEAGELRIVCERLDNWSGTGLIIADMTHQRWDVQLTAYAARTAGELLPGRIAYAILGGTTWAGTVARGRRAEREALRAG
jgi:hypothetical protein